MLSESRIRRIERITRILAPKISYMFCYAPGLLSLNCHVTRRVFYRDMNLDLQELSCGVVSCPFLTSPVTPQLFLFPSSNCKPRTTATNSQNGRSLPCCEGFCDLSSSSEMGRKFHNRRTTPPVIRRACAYASAPVVCPPYPSVLGSHRGGQSLGISLDPLYY